MGARAVYFDAVGTLIHPEPSAAAVYAEVGRRHGSRLERDAIRRRFATAFAGQEQIDRAAGWRTSEARELERWQAIVAEVLDDVHGPAACFAELYAHFARPDAWRCDDAAARVLGELTRRGLIVGLASNFDHRLYDVLAGLPALRGIQRIVVSAEIGWRKPNSAFFAAVCAQAGVEAAQVLYVGNDPACDYDGALTAGMNALLLDSKPLPGVRAIRALDDVLQELM